MKPRYYYTEMTLKNGYGEYAVRVEQIDLDIDEMVRDVVMPLLLAAGYHPEIVRERLGEE